MNLIAKISAQWKNRAYFILIFLFGSIAWFSYDAFIAYPKYNKTFAEYREILTECNGDKTVANQKWVEKARKNGFDTTPPEKEKDIQTQIYFAIGLGIIFLIYLIWAFREMKRIIRANDEEFTGITKTIPPFNGLRTIRFDSIKSLNSTKWRAKGIIIVSYSAEDGSMREVIIDDYKYEGSIAIYEKCKQLLGIDIENK